MEPLKDMMILNPLKDIVINQKKGVFQGIYSACSANEFVIEAVLDKALQNNEYVLIESTANQVNQFGGYTGMKPLDFKRFVYSIADRMNFPRQRIILGGDHLGPLIWRDEDTEPAMIKSKELIRDYVLAGYAKIHIDTSMMLKEDDVLDEFSTTLIAKRSAILCIEAERAFHELKQADKTSIHPVYVIGSEVPIPGGSQDEEELVKVTTVKDFEDTVSTFQTIFNENNLDEAWENVIAFVVQPGVEFGDEAVHDYDRGAARKLTEALKKYPGFVFEGHSTDYQTAQALKEMVEDGIAILKVGPALTFALREALFALSQIEKELFRFDAGIALSRFIETLEEQMLKKPYHWRNHYHGTSEKVRFSIRYSYSDRCRYYLPDENVEYATRLLLENLQKKEIPLTLIRQYMPLQYEKIRNHKLLNHPVALLKDRIGNCLDDYIFATKADKINIRSDNS